MTLEEQMADLRAQLAEKQKEISSLEDQFLEESYRQDAQRKAEAEAAQKKIAELEEELRGIKDGSLAARLRAELNKTLESEAKKHDLVGKRNAEIEQLKLQIEQLQARKTEFENKLKAREDRKADQQKTIRDLNAALERKTDELKVQAKQIETLHQRLTEAEKQPRVLDAEFQAQAEALKKALADKAEIHALATECTDALIRTEKELEAVKAELASVTGRQAAVAAQQTLLQQELKEKQVLLDQAKTSLTDAEKRLTQVTTELAEQTSELTTRVHVLADKDAQIAELKKLLADRPQELREAASDLMLKVEDIALKLRSSLGAPVVVAPSSPQDSGVRQLAFSVKAVTSYRDRLEVCLESVNEALSLLGDQLTPLCGQQKTLQDRFDSASRQNDPRREVFGQELEAAQLRIKQLEGLKQLLQPLRTSMNSTSRSLERYLQLQQRLDGLKQEEAAIERMLKEPIPDMQVQGIIANLMGEEVATTLPSAGLGQSGIQSIQQNLAQSDLKRIAAEQGLSFEGAFILMLGELLPEPNRVGVKMKSIQQLLSGAEKTGIAQLFDFSSNASDFENGLNGSVDFRGTAEQISMFELYGHYYTIQHSVSRNKTPLPWADEVKALLPAEMMNAFAELLVEQPKPPKQKKKGSKAA